MNFYKTSLYSIFITSFRVGSGFLSGKVVSLILGPAGIATLGSFSNFVTIMFSLSNGGISNGIVKYSAKYTDRPKKLIQFLSTASFLSLFFSFFFGLVLILFHYKISFYVLSNYIYSDAILVLGSTLFLFSLNSLCISALNGVGDIKLLTIINAVGSFFSLILTVFCVYFFQLRGALYSIFLSQSIPFFFTLFLIFKNNSLSLSSFIPKINKNFILRLSGFSAMALISGVCVPISQLLIRNRIISSLGLDSAGYWQSVNRVSDGLLLVVTTAMSTYYLPKFSKIFDLNSLKKEVILGLKTILPIVFIFEVIVFFFRKNILSILFSDSFLPAESLFFGQLVGDFFKIGNWMLGYLMIAKSMTKIYIGFEIFFSLTLVSFNFLFIEYFDYQGVTLGYAANNFVSFIIISSYFFYKVK